MEEPQYEQGKFSSHGGGGSSRQHDVNSRAMNDNINKMWIGATMSRTKSKRNSQLPYELQSYAYDDHNHNHNHYERSPPHPTRRSERSAKIVTTTKPKSSAWWCNDAEGKRKRRIAKYKFYSAEGKLKRSVKKGLRWLKYKCIKIMTSNI